MCLFLSLPSFPFYISSIFLCEKKKKSLVIFAGDNESENVLDTFFLGKALAEALNDCIESTVGEFMSKIGRLQSE